jgi:hypothetical protein
MLRWVVSAYRNGMAYGGDLALAMSADATEASWLIQDALDLGWVLPHDPSLDVVRNSCNALRWFRCNPDAGAWTTMPAVMREMVEELAPYAAVPVAKPYRRNPKPFGAKLAAADAVLQGIKMQNAASFADYEFTTAPIAYAVDVATPAANEQLSLFGKVG